MSLEPHAIDALRQRLSGEALSPGSDAYETARRVHNGLIDKRPALIARCRHTADVVAAVGFARQAGLEIAVRGGGHNVAGRGVCEGGVMIDLAPMRGIHVDAKARTARVQPGITWREYNDATQLYGLATTGGVISTTGVAGLTLGGGLGWLMGKHGISIDHLLAVEMVTASGEVLTASAEENSDLWWACRGGGGNFGVVTSFLFGLHEVGPMVRGGLIAFPGAQAAQVLRSYRDATDALPDDCTLFAAQIHSPDGHRLCAIMACHVGSAAEADALFARLRSFGTPAMDALGPIPYGAVNMMLDAGFPRGALNYWKSGFLSALSDGAIDALVTAYAEVPSAMSGLVLECFHGAVTRVPVTQTAFPHRQPGFNVAIASQWIDSAANVQNIAWARQTHAALRPFMRSAVYANYMADDENERVGDAFGPNLERLREVKRRYDPENMFHSSQNLLP